jgi:hypothetical protein
MADLIAALNSCAGAAGGGGAYIEDVFYTWVYTGNGTSQTITNGIDLSGEGGLVVLKSRSVATGATWWDTSRGAENYLLSTTTSGSQASGGVGVTAFSSTGFTVAGSNNGFGNGNGTTYVSWTFRKQPKFFDVITWTGNGASNRTISHSLGSVPGCVIVKNITTASDWPVYHRSLGFSTGGAPYNGLILNGTSAVGTYDPPISAATSTTITLTTSGSNTNQNGETFVAYLFAHDAGGFGDAGDENAVSCGSFAYSSSDVFVNLGYEPQWVMFKQAATGGSGNWRIYDSTRGVATAGAAGDKQLLANTTATETTEDLINFNATGFTVKGNVIQGGDPYIYIAIRRGPMKVPEVGTSVYMGSTYTGAGTTQTVTSGLQTATGSLVIIQDRFNSSASRVYDTKRGTFQEMYTQVINSEVNRTSISAGLSTFNMNGFSLGSNDYNGTNQSGYSYIAWQFARAPSFMDIVCYTGDFAPGSTQAHNLGIAPEMMIVKCRNDARAWIVYHSAMGPTKFMELNSDAVPQTSSAYWQNTAPGSSVFTLGQAFAVNYTYDYVAYLFGSVAGVSKVGSYSGFGTAQQINCGFTTGARFVMIKRIDDVGNWFVWDSARGIVSGNDPYLMLNQMTSEVSSTDWVDTYSAGFEVSNAGGNSVNVNGGTYIFLAIA